MFCNHVLDGVRSAARPPVRTLRASLFTSAQEHRPSSQLEGQDPTRHATHQIRPGNLLMTQEKEEDEKTSRLQWAGGLHSIGSMCRAKESSSRFSLPTPRHPPEFIAQIALLCNLGKTEEAASLLKNAPPVVQNVTPWNTVILHAMKLGQDELAQSVYIDMKKHGHRPTISTYSTMFHYLSRIKRPDPEQLYNARLLYNDFTSHVKFFQSPDDLHFSLDPPTLYIKMLGNAQLYSEMFEVFDALKPDGPLAPTPHVFSTIFNVMSSRPPNDNSSNLQVRTRLLWAQALKASLINPEFIIDTHLATTAIAALRRGQAADHHLGFRIAHHFYGLPAGGSPVNDTLPLSPHTIFYIASLCRHSGKPGLCIKLFSQIKSRQWDVDDEPYPVRRFMLEVLRAYHDMEVGTSGAHSLEAIQWMLDQAKKSLGDIRALNVSHHISTVSDFLPDAHVFTVALINCVDARDWTSARRIFNLMTGYNLSDFEDNATVDHSCPDPPEDRPDIPPTNTVSILATIVCYSGNYAHARQFLRLVDYLGFDNLLARSVDSPGKQPKELLSARLARKVVRLCNGVLNEPDFPEEHDKWRDLSDRAKLVVEENWSEVAHSENE